MALFRGKQKYIALDANNITLVFDSGNIVNISGNIFLYPPQGHPILYNYLHKTESNTSPYRHDYMCLCHVCRTKIIVKHFSIQCIIAMQSVYLTRCDEKELIANVTSSHFKSDSMCHSYNDEYITFPFSFIYFLKQLQ